MDASEKPGTASDPSTIGATPKPVSEPDAARIIATFADVDDDYRAPVTDEAICLCPRRQWGKYEVKLVPFGYAPLQELDSSTLPEALDDARRGKVFLIALSHPDYNGLFAVMTFPRPREPWVGLELSEENWYTRGDLPPYKFGFDQNLACELRFLCIQFLIRDQAPIIARPRPRLALDDLEARYASILAEATEPLMIGRANVATWPRFLEQACNAVKMDRAMYLSVDPPEDSTLWRVLDLARQAWSGGSRA